MKYIQVNTFDEVLSMQEPQVRGYETDDEYHHDERIPEEDVDLERLRGD